jgi:hypothetical protein
MGYAARVCRWAWVILIVVSCDEGATGSGLSSSPPCALDERVVAGACETCPAGTDNEAGDDPSGSDTDCDPIVCGPDERVMANACTLCPAGTFNAAGDDASGPDTSCDPVLCGADERVMTNGCMNCPPGTTNEAGDDASGPDTSCDPVLCGPDEFVDANTCQLCPSGFENEAGDDASGPNTMCDPDACIVALGVSCDQFAEAYLKASNTDENDLFGFSVALDGDTLAVGAWNEDSAATGINGDQSNNDAEASGAVYVFTRLGTTWQQQAYLKASNTDPGDGFGSSVALDGETLAVGAPGESSTAAGVNGDPSNNEARGSGAVYVFTRSGTAWAQQAYLKASNTDEGDSFGRRVALDGDTLAVAASGEDSAATGVDGDEGNNEAEGSGAIYVFTRSGTAWQQQAYLKASNTDPGDGFGWSIAIDGDTLVVGAYQEDGAATGVDGDQRDNEAPLSGAVYVFTRLGTAWRQQAYLKASNTDENDFLGSSVALDGDMLAVGAQGEASTATGVNGDQSNNEAPSGAVYVFTRSDTTWRQQAYVKASNTDPGDGFGISVALDGDTLAVGAWGEDSAATGVDGDQSNNEARESGAVYVFTRSGTTWQQQAYLKASNTDAQDGFGGNLLPQQTLALDVDTLAVGALVEASAATGVNGDQSSNDAPGSGAVYVRRVRP